MNKMYIFILNFFDIFKLTFTGGRMYDIIVQILVGLFVGIILLFIEYFYFLNDKNNKKR